MVTRQFITRGLMGLLSVFLTAGLAFGQNLIVKDGSNYGGTGTYNIKGDIKTDALTVDKSIGGTVKMASTTANQNIGTGAGVTRTLTFGALEVNTAGGTNTTVQAMAGVVVSDALTVANASIFDIQGKTLTIGKSSTLTGTGTIDVDNASSVVNYTRGDGIGQLVLGLNYAGTLNLSGASAKSFAAAGSAKNMTHAGGDLTVNQAWSIGTSGTFATIADVTAPFSFDAAATTASINTITTVSSSLTNNATAATLSIGTLSGNTGTITNNGQGISFTTTATNGTGTLETTSGGALTFAALGGNGGTIRSTGATGDGNLTFTGAASNGGNISVTGGAGAISFGNTLTHTAGTITPGSGDASFTGLVTTSVGAVIAGGANKLDFDGNVNNSGTISSASGGIVEFAGSFVTNVGALALDNASTWNYNGAGDQDIAGASYGHLDLTGGGTKTALGAITVNGNFDNGGGGAGAGDAVVTDMSTFALTQVGVGTKDNFNSTLRFGGNTNGFAFGVTSANAGTVVYNGTTATAPLGQTIAAGSYYQLQFANDAAKTLANTGTVTTGSGVSLGASVTVNLGTSLNLATTLTIQSGGLTLAAGSSTLVNNGTINVTGDLDNSGTLTNNGEITVQ